MWKITNKAVVAMSVLVNVVLILASCIGNTAFWVFVVNRAYSRAINHRLLRRLRIIPELCICGFPVILLARLWNTDAGFLTGGSVGDLTRGSRQVLLLPLTAFAVWLVTAVRWQLFRRQLFEKADRRQHFDFDRLAVDQSAREEIRGSGAGIFGLWPLNEVYQLEVNRKTIELPRRSAGTKLSPVRLVHLSDLHFTGCPGGGFYREMVRRALEFKPDAFIFTGDLIDDVTLLPLACEILSELTTNTPCYFVLGNHDWRYGDGRIRQSLIETGWVDIGSRRIVVELNGVQIHLAGSEMPWLGTDPPAAEDCDVAILLSHSPDQLQFAQRAGYDIMLSGHTHGGQVVLPVAGPVFAPSWNGVKYASGLFEENGLAIHVSRGIGANDPLRWNCTPELTCLTVTTNAQDSDGGG
jgi:uncharacterized protein